MEQFWGEKMTNAEKRVLNGCFLFKGTDILIEKEAEVFLGGETIYAPEKGVKRLGILISGSAAATAADRKTLLNIFEKGDVFGAAALFGNGNDSVCTYITAKSSCKVVFFTEDEIRKMMSESPVIGENYIKFLSDKIRFLNLKISMFSLPTALGRTARYLSFYSEKTCGRVCISSAKLALTLGIGRASLYRAFAELESEEAVKRKGKEIIILDASKLKKHF